MTLTLLWVLPIISVQCIYEQPRWSCDKDNRTTLADPDRLNIDTFPSREKQIFVDSYFVPRILFIYIVVVYSEEEFVKEIVVINFVLAW